MVQVNPKRFYSDVSVVSRTSRDGREHIQILLDDRPLRTPARAELLVPTKALAAAIAEEWRVQGDTIRPNNMPITRLVNTQLDRISPRRSDAVTQILRFAEHDLVCYRAEHPKDLTDKQCSLWDPLVQWIANETASKLETGYGISHVEQSPNAIDALRRAISQHDDWEIAALHAATTVTGSLVIGLALCRGRLSARGAFEAACLDEAYQAERWGKDAEAEERAQFAAGELAAAERFLRLLKS